MAKPVIGVIGNTHVVEGRFAAQRVGENNLRAVASIAGAVPLMFAGTPRITDVADLLDVVDGVLLTGGRANVHPMRFNVEPHAKHEPYDEERDALALPLIEACVARGVPLFGICRGFQEMNVAFGGSLHPEIRELPGRMNHRMPRLENGEIHPDPEVVFAERHDVRLTKDGLEPSDIARRQHSLRMPVASAPTTIRSLSSYLGLVQLTIRLWLKHFVNMAECLGSNSLVIGLSFISEGVYCFLMVHRSI